MAFILLTPHLVVIIEVLKLKFKNKITMKLFASFENQILLFSFDVVCLNKFIDGYNVIFILTKKKKRKGQLQANRVYHYLRFFFQTFTFIVNKDYRKFFLSAQYRIQYMVCCIERGGIQRRKKKKGVVEMFVDNVTALKRAAVDRLMDDNSTVERVFLKIQ